VKVVRRWPRLRPVETPSVAALSTELQFRPARTSVRLVAIGASTGGPPVLQTILAGLPRDFPVPILIVQHIAEGFTHYFVEWLTQSSKLPIHLPTHGQQVLPGHVYVAPDGWQMAITADGRIQLVKAATENGLRPSVSYLFRSVIRAYNSGGVGVLLTGMGRDGASELKLMKDEGAVTIVQDRETSAVYGMPGEAVRLGGASYVLSPEMIYLLLAYLAARRASQEQRTTATESENAIDDRTSEHDLPGS
jgi:two-component system chemotaxis response regulator CheB